MKNIWNHHLDKLLHHFQRALDPGEWPKVLAICPCIDWHSICSHMMVLGVNLNPSNWQAYFHFLCKCMSSIWTNHILQDDHWRKKGTECTCVLVIVFPQKIIHSFFTEETIDNWTKPSDSELEKVLTMKSKKRNRRFSWQPTATETSDCLSLCWSSPAPKKKHATNLRSIGTRIP